MNWEVIVRRHIPWTELSEIELECQNAVALNGNRKFLILSEPLPTYTYGRNSSEHDFLGNRKILEKNGASFAAVARGGKWTYHGPGQIVVFPILHLRTQGFERLGVHQFMDRFRNSALTALESLGVNATPGDAPFGIYVGDAKLASFGVCFKNGISSHGMALYVTPQSGCFQAINPCGVPDAPVRSVEETTPGLTWSDIAQKIETNIKMGLISS